MRPRKLVRRLLSYTPALALFGIGGCLATFQHNLDLLLSPDAIGNALVLPYSPVAELAKFITQFFGG
jgi:hypothetical protein